MGIVWSRSAEQEPLEETANETEAVHESVTDDVERKKLLEDDMRKFKEEIAKKREARSEAIKNLNRKLSELQDEREKERQENDKLKEELEKLRSGNEVKDLKNRIRILENGSESSNEVATTSRVEEAQEMEEKYNEELSDKEEVIEGLERQVKALKDVAMIGTEMLRIRELQVNELKSKLEAIEETGAAYEKEVENMKKLRNLYEERARAMTISHQMELEREKSKLLAAETRQKIAEHRSLELEEKNKELEEKMGKIDCDLDEAKSQISDLKIKLAGKNEDLYNVTSQMAVVNNLFGQLLSPGQDSLEKITKVLEDHHDLVNHLTANGKINDLVSTLVEIADKDPLPASDDQESDIPSHLSKVWRLLVELLGHHIVKPPQEEAPPESCYKSVETPTGPKLVISVSQTFLRLKDLILEKNTLMKELSRLKDLNSTLETRLMEQESRLTVVTAELHSTWSVVNKLKRQHQNLHTNEQVLRYELAQKRLLLNELKKKLEECKENWSLARAKNNQTEKDWKLLRTEFALRKQQASSAESGYEESPTDSQDEEDNWKDKTDKNSSSSDDEAGDPCAVLAWEETEEPRIERRDTLTNSNSSTVDVQNTTFIDFRMDEGIDPCTVLPWTDPEEMAITSQPSSSTDAHRESPPGTLDGSIPGKIADTSEIQCDASTSVISIPSTSSAASTPQPRQRTAEEILQARQDRLRRLEEGCKGLFSKMNQTNQRSEIINSRLTELHEIYGDESRTGRRSDGDEGPPGRDACLGQVGSSTSRIPELSAESLAEVEPSVETSNPPTPPPFPKVPLYLPQSHNTPPSSTVDRPSSPQDGSNT